MYTQKVMDHFKDPHNQGNMSDADSVGQEGNPVCGDVMKMYIKVNDNKIADIKFETLGCAAAIAVSSMVTDLAMGKSLEEILALSKDDIINELGGLPETKIHCSMLGIDALHKAVKNYQKNNK